MQFQSRGSLLFAPLLALGLAAAGGVRAQDGAGLPVLAVSGFGTLGAAHSSEREADYTSSVMKVSGAGASRRWSADVDSRLGLQLDLAPGRRWSAVLQVVSEQGMDNSYRPRVEWANVKFQATPELALRAGRIAMPMFLAAEYRKVGYAYPWIRPPVETYGALPFTSSDGIDASYRWSLGRMRNLSQVFYGHDEEALVPPLRAHLRHLVGLAHTGDWGNLSLRASVMRGELTMAGIGRELFDAYDAFGAAGSALRGRYAVDHTRVEVASIGANYDPGRWFLMAEASRTRSTSLLIAATSVYASAGWRQDAFTPYFTVAYVRAPGRAADRGVPLAGLPDDGARQAAALNAGLDMLLSTIPRQVSFGAGLRWDWHPSSALKLQFDRLTPHDGSRGTLINQTPGFRAGHAIHVASVALDFVY